MTQNEVATNSEKTSNKNLKGLDKAAALMLALPEDFVARMFEAMEDAEVREISQRMATLGNIPSDSVEGLYMEFAESLASNGALSGTFSNTERLLSKIFDTEKVKSIMQEVKGPTGRTMWDKISNVSAEVLVSYLKNEHPQTVAVILSKINTGHAGSVLAALPQEMSMEVIARMLNIEVVQEEILSDVENTLKTEFMTNLNSSAQWNPYEVIADIFNSFDRGTESKFMSLLEKKSPDSAEKVKSLMFTFDDLVKLDSTGVQTLIRGLDKSRLGLALKGTSETIKDLFFGNMSERAAKLLKEDMEALGMVKIKQVDEAQAEIVLKTKELATKGEIIISEGEDDEEMVA